VTPHRRRTAWLSLYAILVIALPGLALLVDPRTTPRSWTSALSLGLAFEAFVILLVQFALVSRLAPISRAIGSDALTRLHRNMGLAALVAVVAHPLLLDAGRTWQGWSPFHGSPGMRAGALAFWITAVVVATSVARRRFRLSYEAWQAIHLAGACGLVAAALAHILIVGDVARAPAMRWAIAAYAAIFLGLLARSRIVRPIRLARRPWIVVSNEDIGASTRLLRVRPDGHGGFAFRPGQFAWLITGRSPLWSGQHPLSIAASDRRPADAAIEFTIKALGDWSSTVVPAIAPGQRVFVDGPFGAFTPDLDADAPLVLVAGGIGIAPIRSMLLSLRDRQDRRPVVLFYAAAGPSRVVLRDEIDRLSQDAGFTVVYVFERPDTAWTGERGLLTADILRRHAPQPIARAHCFVCGPVPMMDAVEAMLLTLGVPPRQIHSERFQVV
jgi:predicted ferric reductase